MKTLEQFVRACGTQAKASDKIGVHPTLLNRWLRGHIHPSGLYAMRLRGMGIEPDKPMKMKARPTLQEYVDASGTHERAAVAIGISRGTLERWLAGVGPLSRSAERRLRELSIRIPGAA